jgi:hypothetical protein
MKDKQERAAEKAIFVERANEDFYFAAKEHELIEGMKGEFQKIEAARREAQIINCSKCPGRLQKYEFMGFVLDPAKVVKGFGWVEAS